MIPLFPAYCMIEKSDLSVTADVVCGADIPLSIHITLLSFGHLTSVMYSYAALRKFGQLR